MSATIGKPNVLYEVLNAATVGNQMVQQVENLATRLEFSLVDHLEEYEIKKAIEKGAAYSIQMPFSLGSKIYFDGAGEVVGGLRVRDEYTTFITKAEEFD